MINAFHPDYMKTHHPDFWSGSAAAARKSELMSEIVSNTRKTKPNHGTFLGISNRVTPVSLKPLDFMVFSKAGVKNVTPKHRRKK